MFVVVGSSSVYLLFDLAALEDLEDEEDLGEEEDLVFFHFFFLEGLGISAGGKSLNISVTGWRTD